MTLPPSTSIQTLTTLETTLRPLHPRNHNQHNHPPPPITPPRSTNLVPTRTQESPWSQTPIETLCSMASPFLEQEEVEVEKVGGHGVLANMAGLGLVFRDQGRWKEAEEVLLKTVKASQKTFGGEDPDTLKAMAGLALTYNSQGRWDEAQELFMRVVGMSERVLGKGHPDTLKAMVGLAMTYNSQGRWEEAGELLVRVVKMSEEVLGKEHPDTLTAMACLASTYGDQGRLEEAEGLFVEVASTMERVLGKEHPETLKATTNLASTYCGQGRWKEAENLEREIIETQKKHLGEQHPDTLASMAHLGLSIQRQGKLRSAQKLFQKALEGESIVLGPEHPSTLKTVGRLADVYLQAGSLLCLEAAKELYLRAFYAWGKTDGWSLPTSLGSIEALIQVYYRLGENTSARELSRCLVRKLNDVSKNDGELCILSRNEKDEMYIRRYADAVSLGAFLQARENTKTPRIFCTFKDDRFPDWAVPVLSREFGFHDDFKISQVTETTSFQHMQMLWKWAYTSQFRVGSVEINRIARQVDVAKAEVGATLKCSISYFIPVLEQTQDLNHSQMIFKEKVFTWIMTSNLSPEPEPEPQSQTTKNNPEASPSLNNLEESQEDEDCSVIPSIADNVIGQKYLKLKELFLVDNNLGFPETAADFVIANLEWLDREWYLLICEGISRVRIRNDTIMAANGKNAQLVQQLLQDANRWSIWKIILNSHIEGCLALTKDLTSDAIRREVEVYCQQRKIKSWSIEERMTTIVENLRKHLERVDEELEKKTERSIQLEFNLSSIHDVHRSTHMAESMKRLSWITFIFLPLVFVASLFGMNIDILSQNGDNPKWWWYLVCGGCLSVIVMVFWSAFKYFPIEEYFEQQLERLILRRVKRRRESTPGGGLADVGDLEKGSVGPSWPDKASVGSWMVGLRSGKNRKEE